MRERLVFQDGLFDRHREVVRVLESGTVLRLTLEPLPGERVRIVRYERQRRGARRERDKSEEGRVVAYGQLGLPYSFTELFG